MKQPNSAFCSRRRFLRASAATLAAATVLPGHILGLHGATPPSSKLNLGFIGVAGRGGANLDGCAGENIVALCDVDRARLQKAQERFPQAKAFQDYRKMMDEVGRTLDAVVVSTPDHTHAVALMRAIKERKHVYSEKPLAHCVQEIRALRAAARQYKVVTQLGNQGHSSDSIRRFHQMIQSGFIGPVREIHAFCGSNYSRVAELERAKQEMPVPETLDWDLWLGPAPWRPYNSCYVPGKWRGWLQFGTGVIGDWVCHVVDPVFWALNLTAPVALQAEVMDYDPKLHAETCPPGTRITYEFAAQGTRPALKLIWYDGKWSPPTPEEMGTEKLPGIGAVVVGEKGKIVYGSHGAGSCRMIPDAKMDEYRELEKTLPPNPVPKSPGHYAEWLRACKGGPPALSHFDYGGPLTEIALLGVIAFRYPGTRLQWDAARAQFTNHRDANRHLLAEYRKGWSL
ncbi:MAG: Gfo/Idh/MocA family oxidoreductase [Verrucomicrobiae bacterium]|nr:Gfo/Idh/MocA family oxidoreductase [Verrucomicrobiae bacterium]